jgi:hypothetical protein
VRRPFHKLHLSRLGVDSARCLNLALPFYLYFLQILLTRPDGPKQYSITTVIITLSGRTAAVVVVIVAVVVAAVGP